MTYPLFPPNGHDANYQSCGFDEIQVFATPSTNITALNGATHQVPPSSIVSRVDYPAIQQDPTIDGCFATQCNVPADQATTEGFSAEAFLKSPAPNTRRDLVKVTQRLCATYMPRTPIPHVGVFGVPPFVYHLDLPPQPQPSRRVVIRRVHGSRGTNNNPSFVPRVVAARVLGFCICTCERQSIPCPLYESDAIGWTGSRSRLGQLILFSVDGDCGISIVDAAEGRLAGLEGRDDWVFVGAGFSATVSIRFMWPCYELWTRTARTQDHRRDPRPTSRSKIAQDVSRLFVRFIDEMARKPFDDASRGREWRVGVGFIETRHVILVGLERVSQGSLQPHFRLMA